MSNEHKFPILHLEQIGTSVQHLMVETLQKTCSILGLQYCLVIADADGQKSFYGDSQLMHGSSIEPFDISPPPFMNDDNESSTVLPSTDLAQVKKGNHEDAKIGQKRNGTLIQATDDTAMIH